MKKSRSSNLDKKWLKCYFCKFRRVSWPTFSALSPHTVFVLRINDQSAAIRRSDKVTQMRARAHFWDFSRLFFHDLLFTVLPKIFSPFLALLRIKYDSLQNYNEEEYDLRFKVILADIFLDLTSCLSLKSTVSILGIYRCWNNT